MKTCSLAAKRELCQQHTTRHSWDLSQPPMSISEMEEDTRNGNKAAVLRKKTFI